MQRVAEGAGTATPDPAWPKPDKDPFTTPSVMIHSEHLSVLCALCLAVTDVVGQCITPHRCLCGRAGQPAGSCGCDMQRGCNRVFLQHQPADGAWQARPAAAACSTGSCRGKHPPTLSGQLCNAIAFFLHIITSPMLLQVSPSQASVKGLLTACQQAAPALRDLSEELATSEVATQQQVVVQRRRLHAACEPCGENGCIH